MLQTILVQLLKKVMLCFINHYFMEGIIFIPILLCSIFCIHSTQLERFPMKSTVDESSTCSRLTQFQLGVPTPSNKKKNVNFICFKSYKNFRQIHIKQYYFIGPHVLYRLHIFIKKLVYLLLKYIAFDVISSSRPRGSCSFLNVYEFTPFLILI